MPKSASFLLGFLDELQKLGYNGGAAMATIRPGSAESKALRRELKTKGVKLGKQPGILTRALHKVKRIGKPSARAQLRVGAKPVSEKTQSKAISSALGGSLSDIPSLPKVAFMHGLLDELEKNGVTFGKTPGKPMKATAILRRLKRKAFGPPQSQVKRMGFKHMANVAAAHFSEAAKDVRAAGRSKRALAKGQRLLDKRERVVKALTPHRRMGPAVTGFLKRNPEMITVLALPPAMIAGAAGAAALAKRISKKKKKGMEKKAGPPTLAKLRRAYPKGKVKPPVADPQAAAKAMPEMPKAAMSLEDARALKERIKEAGVAGRAKYLAKRLAAPIRRLKAEQRGAKALEAGEMRKALRYGGVSAGLGPSFGREPKKAKRLLKSLEVAPAKS
jgi:hypothetical protein